MGLTYNKEKLLSLFQDYYTVTGLRIALFEPSGSELLAYPQELAPFCQYIRQSPQIQDACWKSDCKALSRCRTLPGVYKCHLGLTEAAAPIFHDGILLGYIMTGQVLEAQNDCLKQLMDRLPSYLLSEQKFFSYYEQLPRFSAEKILACLHLICACAAYLLSQNLVRRSQTGFISLLIDFIDAHLEEDLDIPYLCCHFSIGKTKLCQKVKEGTGVTVQKLIQMKRLERAAVLLLQTDKTISEISGLVGIADYSYFSKLFQKWYGKTPSSYRRDAAQANS